MQSRSFLIVSVWAFLLVELVSAKAIAASPSLAVGWHHTCALTTSGHVNCWGANGTGALGDGAFVSKTLPVSPVGLTGVVAVGVGQSHSCAVLEGGTIRCWGDNGHGQIGDGTTLLRATPVAVVGLRDAKVVSTQVLGAAGQGYLQLHDVSSTTSTMEDVANADVVFSWAERTHAQVFAPAGAPSQSTGGYRYRAYAGGHFLAVNEVGIAHLYYLGPLSNNAVLDLGLLSAWLSQANPVVEIGTTKVSVTVDTKLGSLARDLISRIVSPVEMATSGVDLAVPVFSNSEAPLILALDANDNIVLSGYSTASGLTLGADSTAVSLVCLALGSVPSTIATTQLDTAIRTAPDFAALVSAIGADLSKGIAASASSSVLQRVATVAGQAAAALKNTSPKIARTIPPEPDRVSDQLPFGLLTTSWLGGVAVKDSLVAGAVDVVNSTQIAWTVRSLDYQGTPLPNAPGSPVDSVGRIQLPAASLQQRLTSTIAGSAIAGVVTQVPNDGGRGFTVELSQTFLSRYANVAAVFSDVALLVAEQAVGSVGTLLQGCSAKLYEVLITPDELAQLAQDPSSGAFVAYLQNTSLSAAGFEALNKCMAQKKMPTAAAIATAKRVGAIMKFLTGLSKINTGLDLLGLSSKVRAMVEYWSYGPKTWGICQTEGTLYDYKISSCAKELKFDPEINWLAVGAIVESKSNLKALDAKGDPTAVPSGLIWSQNDQGEVVTLDNKTATVTAKDLGTAQVKVTDPATGVSATYTAAVVNPVIAPNPLNLNVGQSGFVSLSDGYGHAVKQAPGTTWASDDRAIASIDLTSSLITGKVTVKGNAAGATRLRAFNGMGGWTSSADVLVENSVQISFDAKGMTNPERSGRPLSSQCAESTWWDDQLRKHRKYTYCSPQYAIYVSGVSDDPSLWGVNATRGYRWVADCTETVNRNSGPPAINQTGLGNGTILLSTSGNQRNWNQVSRGNAWEIYQSGEAPPVYFSSLNVTCNVQILEVTYSYPRTQKLIRTLTVTGSYP